MTFAIILAVCCLLACLGITFFVMWKKRDKTVWTALPGGPLYTSVRLAPLSYTDEKRLIRMIDIAKILCFEAGFKTETVEDVFKKLRIVVQATPQFVSLDHGGTTIAGMQVGYMVWVGSDFAALFHESAHVCEWFENGRVPLEGPDHANWEARGLNILESRFLELSKGV